MIKNNIQLIFFSEKNPFQTYNIVLKIDEPFLIAAMKLQWLRHTEEETIFLYCCEISFCRIEK